MPPGGERTGRASVSTDVRPALLFRALLGVSLAFALTPSGASADEPGTGCRPIALRAGSALPVGSGMCPGVRPGAFIETPLGGCTLNFLFTGSDRNRYIGTAGHCFLGEGPFPVDAGEKVYRWPKGPIVKDAAGTIIGRAVYAVLQQPKDFALIRLLPGVKASASMCFFGGPTSASTATGPGFIHYFGNGLAIGEILPARSALVTNVTSPDHVYAQGVVLPGDSGGGVIDDAGRAVGVLVTTGVHADRPSDSGTVGITRLQPQLARAAKILRLRFTLRTAPLA